VHIFLPFNSSIEFLSLAQAKDAPRIGNEAWMSGYIRYRRTMETQERGLQPTSIPMRNGGTGQCTELQ
jgi:hypothetical protein